MLDGCRKAIALLLHRSFDCDKPEQIRRNMTRRLQRNEQARFHHWMSHKRMAPKRVPQNE